MFKYNLLSFSLLLLSISINAQKTDLEIIKLKGPVKKVENFISDNRLSSIDFYSEKGMLEKEILYDYDYETEKLLSIDSILYTYNKDTRLIKELRFDSEGIDTVAYFYNTKRRLTKEVYTIQDEPKPWIKKYSYNKIGKTTLVYETGRGRTNREITEYDTKNRKTKVIFQYGNDDDLSKPNYIELYDYDDEKNIVTYNKYSPRYENKHVDKNIQKYDANYNIIEKTHYKPQRMFETMTPSHQTKSIDSNKPNTTLRYTYNKNEDLINVTVLNENNRVVKQHFNEYDDKNRLAKETRIENKETFIETTKYDKSDNIVEFAAYKKTLKNKPIYFRTYTFNDEGQETKETYIVDKAEILKKTYYDEFGNNTREVHSKKGKVILTNYITNYYYYN